MSAAESPTWSWRNCLPLREEYPPATGIRVEVVAIRSERLVRLYLDPSPRPPYLGRALDPQEVA